MELKNNKGLTLIELLVVIAIIGFLVAAATYSYQLARIKSRDALRANNIDVLRRALAAYLNEHGDYPTSAGECFSGSSGAGQTLINDNKLNKVPLDPLWPDTPPNPVNGGQAGAGASNFCYYYSSDSNDYYLSYYLETDSNAGTGGINIIHGQK